MKQQAVLELPGFSFFVIGWIHEPLHSFNRGAFQALIVITAQMVEDAQGECIERCPAQFFDQLRLAGARCARDHNHVASPTALVAPPHFVACRVAGGNLACRRSSIPVRIFSSATAGFLSRFFRCLF